MHNQYIVVEPVLVVAQDLAMAIRTHDPLAEVRLFRDVDEALAALPEMCPRFVFLNAGLIGARQGRIEDAILKAGIPLAFTGAEAEFLASHAHVLASPFTEATVASLLKGLAAVGTDAGDDA